MAKTQSNHAFTTFLIAVLTCQIILAQGRQLKSANEAKLSSNVNTYVRQRTRQGDLVKKVSGHTSFGLLSKSSLKSKSLPNQAQVHALQPASPGSSASVGHTSEMAQVGSKGYGKDHNPEGRMIQSDQNGEYLTEEHQLKGEPNVLVPNGTNPGQSPGVGHAFAKENKEAKSNKQSHL